MKKLRKLLSDISSNLRWKQIWKRVLTGSAGIVVFITIYMLILPAVAIDKKSAEETPGIYLNKIEDGAEILDGVTADPAVNGADGSVEMLSADPQTAAGAVVTDPQAAPGGTAADPQAVQDGLTADEQEYQIVGGEDFADAYYAADENAEAAYDEDEELWDASAQDPAYDGGMVEEAQEEVVGQEASYEYGYDEADWSLEAENTEDASLISEGTEDSGWIAEEEADAIYEEGTEDSGWIADEEADAIYGEDTGEDWNAGDELEDESFYGEVEDGIEDGETLSGDEDAEWLDGEALIDGDDWVSDDGEGGVPDETGEEISGENGEALYEEDTEFGEVLDGTDPAEDTELTDPEQQGGDAIVKNGEEENETGEDTDPAQADDAEEGLTEDESGAEEGLIENESGTEDGLSAEEGGAEEGLPAEESGTEENPAEAAENPEESSSPAAAELSAEYNGTVIRMIFDDAAAIPEGSVLYMSEYDPENPEEKEFYEKYAELANQASLNEEGEDEWSVSGARVYAVRVEDPEGRSLQIDAHRIVELEFPEEAPLHCGELRAALIRQDENGEEKAFLLPVLAERNDDNDATECSFEADDLSVFCLVWNDAKTYYNSEENTESNTESDENTDDVETASEEGTEDEGEAGGELENTEESLNENETAPEELTDSEETAEPAETEEKDLEEKEDEEKEASSEEGAEDAIDAETDAAAEKTDLSDPSAASQTELSDKKDENADKAEETVYPAQTFSEKAESGVKVQVYAGEGAFPAGTTMTVEDVDDEDTIGTITDFVEKEVSRVKAVNITFYDKDGNEIEPKKEIRVVMSAEESDKTEEIQVVHVDNDGNPETVEDVNVIERNGVARAQIVEAGKEGKEESAPSDEAEAETEDTDPENAAVYDESEEAEAGEDPGSEEPDAESVNEEALSEAWEEEAEFAEKQDAFEEEVGEEIEEDSAEESGETTEEDFREGVSEEEYSGQEEEPGYEDYAEEAAADAVEEITNGTGIEEDVTAAEESAAGFDENEETVNSGTEVEFTADEFSIYAMVYTVDFHWEVDGKTYEFSIPGGGYMSFTELVEILGIAEADEGMDVRKAAELLVSNVAEVKFSAPELLSVSKIEDNTTVGAIKDTLGLVCEYSLKLTGADIEAINSKAVRAGDWALISVRPFETEEELKVTMNNGETFSIRVTDAQIRQTVISASGETYEIIVTYDDRAGIPDGAELKVREITAEDEDYAKIRSNIEAGLAAESQTAEEMAGEETVEAPVIQPVNPVLFDIAIWDGEKEIEPAEGSRVKVEVKLAGDVLKGVLSDENTPLLINDAPVQVENGYVEKNLQVIHQNADGNVEVMDTFDNITAEELMATFSTDSFSSWLVFLDESATEITVGPGDSIVLRPYNEWSWDKPENQGDNWVNPGNDSTVTDAANVSSREINDTNLNHTYTIYTLTIKNNAANKEFDVKTEGGRTIHIKVANTTPEPNTPPTVSTVNNAEEGIIFNLYDYDKGKTLDEQGNEANKWTSQTQNNNMRYETGTINEGHALKFLGWGGSGNSNGGTNWGQWAHGIQDYTNTTVRPGIVASDLVEYELDDGSKILVPKLAHSDFNNENLGYLFDTDSTWSNTGNRVQAYKDANGLFQKGSNGYYYYNSNQNYAYYDGTKFEVYEHTYQQHTGKNEAGNGKPIGFFPFHPYEADTDTDGTHGTAMNFNKYLNHHFGMDMSVEFSVPADGLDEFGNPITFEFSGDDDLWVFIDGKLVLDVGGIHQPVTASINFSNDVVKVNGQADTTIQDMFNKSTSSDKTWTKGDDVPHTMRVFYMERGGCDSNLSIRFNLPTKLGKTKLNVVKRDRDTNAVTPLKGAEFELYDNGRCEGTPIRTGITNDSGELSLGELSIADASTTYYLKEKSAPSGFVVDSTVYQVRPKLTDGKITRDSSNYVEMEVVSPDGNVQLTVTNGSIVFPNDKIEKLNVPGEKTWTDDIVTENAQVTLTIKRYKLVDLTNGLYIVQDLNGKPDNYQFQADYTVTYPDGHQINVDYTAFSSGVYKVPDTVPGNYTVEQNIRSAAPDRYNMTNAPADFTHSNVTLAEYPGASATAEFKSTFTAKTGTLHLTASATGTSVPSFTGVRYAIIDSNGKKVGSATYAELSGNGGKSLTLPIGTYSVRALNMPDDPSGIVATHTVQQNGNTPGEGTTLGNIVITENGTTNVAFNSNYANPVSNCHFQVLNRFNNSSHMWEDMASPKGLNLKSGDQVTLTLYIKKDRIYFDPTGGNTNDTVLTSGVDHFEYLGEEGNCYKFDVTFTVENNKTIQFKINEHGGYPVDHWTIRKANRASANSFNTAPMRFMKAAAVSSGENISLDNDAELPAAPDFKKYVKDDSWSGTIVLTKNNSPQAWHDVLNNLDATDSDGNKYYYYVSHVDETNLESDAETTCEIGVDENGKMQLISIDNYQNNGISLSINNTVKRHGALMLTKIVTLNDVDSTTNLTDGDYKFSIEGVAGTATAGVQHTVTIHFAKGRATWYKIDNETKVDVVGLNNSWSVVLNGLEAGEYTITETEQPTKMTLKRVTGGKGNGDVSQKKITATVVAGDETPEAGSAKVDFTNNREEKTTITVSKEWEPAPDPSDNPSVTFELRRYAKKTNGTINITLKDDNGAAIKDAQFELYRDGQSTGMIYTTDVNGRTSAAGLEGPHTYQLKQILTPQRYTMVGDGVKTVSDVLTVSDTSAAVQEVNTDDLVNKILVTSATIELTLTDSGAGDGTRGDPIVNGTFTLYKDGTAMEGTYTTDDYGKLKITVGPGQYQFVQTGTAENYRMPVDPAVTPAIEVVDEPWREQNYKVGKTNDLKGKGTIVVDLKKKDDNQPVEGARFQLKQGDSLVASNVTDADGYVRFENVYEGVYTIHQVDAGGAGSDYALADDQSAEILVNSETGQTVEKHFVNESTAGNVTFKLWKKQGKEGNETNWVLMDTITGKKVNHTYDFTATVNAQLYPNNIWFYTDTGDYTSNINEQGTFYYHTMNQDNVSPLSSSGWNNGTYAFSFTPTEDNTTYNLVLVSGWGFDDIYSFSMNEPRLMMAGPASTSVPTGTQLSIPRLTGMAKGGKNLFMAPAVRSVAPANVPEGYVDDINFHISKTLTSVSWNYTFPAQDKYDKNGDPYYYYVVETAHEPSEYTVSELTFGEPTNEDGTFTFTNRKPQHGGLEIIKEVMYNGAAADTDAKKVLLNGNYTFEVKQNGIPISGSPFTITVTNGVSNSLFIPDLDEGDYTIEETGFNGLTLMSATGGSSVENNIVTVHVTAGKNTAAELESNAKATFINTKYFGDLELTKRIAGNGADAQKGFNFTIALEAPEGETLQAQYAYTKTGISGQQTLELNLTDNDTKATITGISLKAYEIYTIIGLPENTKYTITEDDYSGEGYSANFTAGASSGTVPGGASAKASVEVTNTLSAGSLIVEKVLSGNAADPEKNFSFLVNFSKSGLNGTAGSYTIGSAQAEDITFTDGVAAVNFTMKGGQQVEFSGLPTGTSFTVEELSKDGDGYETTVAGTAGSTVDTTDKTVSGEISATAAVTVTCTNTKNTTTAEAVKVWKSGEQTIEWPGDVEYVKFTLYKTVNGVKTEVTASDLANTATQEEIEAFMNPAIITKSTADHKARWEDLPEKYLVSENWYDATYMVEETEIAGAASMVPIRAEDGVITNELPKVDIHATKEWLNKNDTTTPPDGAQVTFTLMADGEITTHTVLLDGTDETAGGATPASTDYEGKNWTAWFTELPKYKNDGTVINYTVKETGKMTGYEVEGSDTVDDGGTIINKEITLEINILKVDKTDEETPLSGAKFVLKRYEEGYYTSVETWPEQETSSKEGEKGILKFENLAIGYYELEETEPPAGYVKTSTNPRFEIKADTDGSLKVVFKNTNMVTYESSDKTFKVRNEPGAALPNTGGPGTNLIYFLGSMLIMLASAGLVMKRRRRNAA